jgi:hypothetical protein
VYGVLELTLLSTGFAVLFHGGFGQDSRQPAGRSDLGHFMHHPASLNPGDGWRSRRPVHHARCR